MANSETILTEQTHPGDSTVESVTGDKFKGDGYYGRSDGLHTVQYSVLGLKANLSIQATLALDPQEQDWFTVYTKTYDLDGSSEDSSLRSASEIENFTGNYVWIRATLDNWTDGSVNSIKLNH
jgi:hypothetical protein